MWRPQQVAALEAETGFKRQANSYGDPGELRQVIKTKHPPLRPGDV